MSIDLIVTLYTDADGNDKFRVDYPETETDLVDVTDQFKLTTIEMPTGEIGFCVFKKLQPATLGCHDGPLHLET